MSTTTTTTSLGIFLQVPTRLFNLLPCSANNNWLYSKCIPRRLTLSSSSGPAAACRLSCRKRIAVVVVVVVAAVGVGVTTTSEKMFVITVKPEEHA